MTKRFFFTMMLFAFVLTVSACSGDGSREVIGAWKTVEPDSITGKPDTLLIDEKTLLMDNDLKLDIVFEKKDGKILMRKAGGTVGYLATIIDKDTIKVDRNILGEQTYVRTTLEELQRIAAAPSPGLESKPDPF